MKKIHRILMLIVSILCLAGAITAASFSASAATSVSKLKVTSISDQIYTGKALKPSVTVKNGSKTLKKGTSYTVSYSNNKNPGYASVKITGKGSYKGTKTVKFKIVSPAVKNLKFSGSTKTSVVLKWSASKKATGYQIYKYSGSAYKLVTNVRTTSYTLKGLSAGSTYKVKVRPYNKLSSGEVLYGSFCSVVKVLTLPSDVATPTQTTAGNKSATVSWKKCTGASGYTVYSVDASGKETAVKSTTSTSYKFTSLKGEKKVRVAAYRNINSKKAYSAKSKVITLGIIPSGTVQSVKTSGISSTYVTVKWAAVEGAKYYGVYKSSDGVNYTFCATSSSTSKKIAGLMPCTDYFFKVCPAVKCSGSYFYSSILSEPAYALTLPGTMSGLSAGKITNTSLALSWTPAENVTGYELYVLDANAGDYTLCSTVGKTTAELTALDENTAYSFKGRAFFTKADGNVIYGAFSQVIDVKTDDSIVDTVTLSQTEASLWLGDSITLNAQALPTYAADRNVLWTSSDETVATVDENGTVTAVDVGKADIIATAADGGNARAVCKLTVKRKVSGIKLDGSALSIAVNEQTAMTYELMPSNATDKSVSFKSSNTSVFTVSEVGLITGKAAGSATLTVTSKDNASVKATCKVTVTKVAAASITAPLAVTIYEGQSYTFSPVFSPANTSDKSFTVSVEPLTAEVKSESGTATDTYTYSAASYLKVTSDKKGITGVKATTIKPASYKKTGLLTRTFAPEAPKAFTVKLTSANGKTSFCSVNVIPATSKISVSSVSLYTKETVWYPGKQGTMAANLTPVNATEDRVKWTSSNTDVAVIDASGKILALSPGATTIKAVTVDGSKKATMKITVTDRIAPDSVSISQTLIEAITVGEKAVLTAAVSPENANEPNLIWSSSDQSIAYVYNGTVYALREGTAVITATSANGITASCAIHIYEPGVRIKGQRYYEGCQPGETIQLEAEAYCPEKGRSAVTWHSENEAVAVVNENGLVTVTGQGKTKITAVCADNDKLTAYIGINTDVYAAPDTENTEAFLQTLTTSLNKVKTEDLPSYDITKNASINDLRVKNFTISGLIGVVAGAVIGDDEINDLLSEVIDDDLESDRLTVRTPKTGEDALRYFAYLPLSNQPLCVSEDFKASAVKSCDVEDKGNSAVLTIELNDENLASLPKIGSETQYASNHGKIFDIYCQDDIDVIFSGVKTAGIDISYSGISSKFSGSSVSVTIDKFTEKVIGVSYILNSGLTVKDCEIVIDLSKVTSETAITIDKSFSINTDIEISLGAQTNVDFQYDF